MKRIGIIGVGLLGSAVAARLLQAKFQVKGFDTNPTRLRLLQNQGLIVAGSIAELAADSDAVFTILPSLEAVETTILGSRGLLETAPRDCTLIQMSTVSPELTRHLAAAALAEGLGFLDAPMSGNQRDG
jgi:2-hydroxy-3-oxopropionate reductase